MGFVQHDKQSRLLAIPNKPLEIAGDLRPIPVKGVDVEVFESPLGTVPPDSLKQRLDIRLRIERLQIFELLANADELDR